MTENESVFASEMSPALAKHEATARDDAASSSSEFTAAAAAEPEDAAARELSAQDASGLQTNDSIELSRRAVPEVEQDPDVCSICLDEFTDDDPSNSTQCGHMYHLQCIMQWAQRSHECPMCFKTLGLQEEALNELLPFGEYRPPDQSTPSHVLLGIEAWELDRLLARLAVHGGSGRRSRAARHAARASRASATRAAAESSAASGSAAAAGGGAAGSVGGADSAGSDPHRAEAAATMPVPMQRDGRHGNGSGSGSGDSTNGEAYPASWPPAGYASRQYSRESEGHDGSSSPAVDLRTRWAGISLRAKESLSKTTSELKSLWSRGSARNGHPGSGTAA